MRKLSILRALFQLLALGLFVYQFQNSIFKYVTGPITTQTSTTTLKEIQQPLIYLCQEGQFNYTEARKIGYSYLTDFTMGKIADSNNYTWNGRYGNISYHEIQDRIYNTDYNDVELLNSHTGELNDFKKADTKMVYFAQFGFCLNIESTKKFTNVRNTARSELYLVDPAGANKLSMYDSNAAKIIIGPTRVGYYDDMVFKIEVRIHDTRIHHDQNCMDYGRMGTSYDSCVLNEMEKYLLKWYKCLPPWFPKNSTLTCLKLDVIEVNDVNLTMHTQFSKYLTGLGMDTLLTTCLPPCVSMRFKLHEVFHISNRINNAAVDVKIKDEIIVYTDVYAYDMFSLVVDLGSSLGLWLGLSALSIFDILVEFCMAAKRKYYH